MNMTSYIPNSQWEVSRVTVENMKRSAYLAEVVELSMIRHTIEMTRKPMFYVCTLIVPCMLLTGNGHLLNFLQESLNLEKFSTYF